MNTELYDTLLDHHRAVTPLGHPPDLAPWCFVWEGLDPADFPTLEPNEVEDYTLRLAQAWASPLSRSRVADPSGSDEV